MASTYNEIAADLALPIPIIIIGEISIIIITEIPTIIISDMMDKSKLKKNVEEAKHALY